MKQIILIENDSFIKRLQAKLESWNLHQEYELVVIDPPLDDDEDEVYSIEPILADVAKLVAESQVALILVDIQLFPDIQDTHGIRIAESLKTSHPNIPVLNITYHFSEDELTGIFSQAVLSVNDGVLPKSLFTRMDGQSFQKMVKKVSKKIAPLVNKGDLEVEYSHIDYAIVTALYEDEFEQLMEVFQLSPDTKTKLGSKTVYKGILKTENGDKQVIATYQSETGRVDSSSLVTEIIKEYKPKYVIMSGVCGGDESLSFGDVVIAKYVFTIDKGKITDQGFFRELELVKIDETLLRIIRENKKQILIATKKSHLDNESKVEKYKDFNTNNIKAIIDPMACSSAVIDKQNYFKEVIKMVERKTSAVEMECYGVARAAETTDNGISKALIIKSVMDNTKDKDDSAKSYASYTSALFVKNIIELNILPL